MYFITIIINTCSLLTISLIYLFYCSKKSKGRSLTEEQIITTSFNTLEKNDDRNQYSQEKLTSYKCDKIEFGTKPYDQVQIGHTSFILLQQSATD